MKILVCVDDDPAFDAVVSSLSWCLGLSGFDTISVLHVVAPGRFFLAREDVSPQARGERLLAAAESRVAGLGVRVETGTASGDPPQEIVRASEEFGADLIVLGALGGGPGRGFLMGSVSQKVVSLASTDVLVVRADEDGAGRQERREGQFRALVAVDRSPHSLTGVEAFARKTKAATAAIRLVHVIDAPPAMWALAGEEPASIALTQSFESRGEEILARAARLLNRYGLSSERECRRGSPAAEILEVARSQPADVIVVGSRRLTGLREVVLGSITQRILRHAPCSVLCARGLASDDLAFEAWSMGGYQPGTA